MTIDCNCPWIKCPAHIGSLCARSADETKCGFCDDIHYIGEVFAKGIHLCTECAAAASRLVNADLCELMNAVIPSAPPELGPLTDAIHDFYMDRAKMPGPWENPIHDVQAVLGLILCLKPYLSHAQIAMASEYLERFITFRDAYHPTKEKERV